MPEITVSLMLLQNNSYNFTIFDLVLMVLQLFYDVM